MTDLAKEYTSCRNCGNGNLALALDLGSHAISDFYERPPENEVKIPLRIVICEKCGLAQLSHSVSKDRLYKDYWYRSSGNEAMVEALKDVITTAKRFGSKALEEHPYVLDIGANDATLLRHYPKGIFRTGFEPAGNFREDLSWMVPGDVWFSSYFPPPEWTDGWQEFSVITSIAMFYDVDDPNKFVDAIKRHLRSNGLWINQMMDLESMLTQNAVDNICHEHVTYWHEDAFLDILHHHELRAPLTAWNAINGGSIRHIIMKDGYYEGDYGTGTFFPLNAFQAFSNRVCRQRDLLMANLELWRRAGKRVLGYGASTKGNTLLQYYGITPDLLPAIAERNPAKVGKITAGQHIPIISEEEMREQKPDYLLILPWAFLDNFLEREKELRSQGTKFIVPLPEFRVL